MAKKSSKIVRYKKPLNINVGMIIFAMIFVYLAFSVYTYVTRKKIQFYEVVQGSIVNDKIYSGLIFRQEQVKKADKAGYVNYYIREGKRAAAGSRIYSVDESGQMEKFLQDNQNSGIHLSSDNLSDLKKRLSAFCVSYDDMNFSGVYDEKYAIQAAVSEDANFNALDNLDAAMKAQGINVEQVFADQAGVISYAMDSTVIKKNPVSFDGLSPTAVTAEMFDKKNYTCNIGKSGELIASGSPVYKLIPSEDWSVVFPLSDTDKTAFDGKSTLQVKVKNEDLTMSGRYSQITGADGAAYGKLDFSKYMVHFVTARFLDFEVVTGEADGLKIPVSSVTTKEFYTIPVEYLAQGGDSTSSGSGFYKEVYSDKGGSSIVFTPMDIYNMTDQYCYVDKSDGGPLKSGDYVVKPNSKERFQIGPTASLEGVYNINKGYAVFKLINKLAGNGEFYTIEKGTKYGLSVYDHIVLDASTVTDGEVIYQ